MAVGVIGEARSRRQVVCPESLGRWPVNPNPVLLDPGTRIGAPVRILSMPH